MKYPILFTLIALLLVACGKEESNRPSRLLVVFSASTIEGNYVECRINIESIDELELIGKYSTGDIHAIRTPGMKECGHPLSSLIADWLLQITNEGEHPVTMMGKNVPPGTTFIWGERFAPRVVSQ